ncbi:MAG: insulinase family protein [Cytophagia bacterium]|nr:insulinase family protein [Cytophagia bacterium]
MKDCTIFKLSNGIRVVHQHIAHTKIVHCGLFLGIGSRDENTENQGIAHFWEHMAFKGTKKRSTLDIITSLDSVGGELNAYTDKEKIVFFASVRDQYFERAVDLLSDITFNSTLPEKELEKERGVILEEMSMYFDSPDDSLQDEFENIVYDKHPMGMNILGRKETVSRFTRKDFKQFFDENLSNDKIVFSCIGNITLGEVEKMVKKYLEKRALGKASAKRKKINVYKATEKLLTRPVKQAKCAIGSRAYPIHHNDRVPFYLLVNMLGGSGMNSRLNLSLREKYGYVYSIDAHYIPYADTGLFAIFFGTEPKQLDRCIKLVKKELDRFREKKLSQKQLDEAKEQIKGQMAMSEENNLSLMMMMGRSILDYNRVPSIEEVFEKINAITPASMLRIANEMFREKELSQLIIKP